MRSLARLRAAVAIAATAASSFALTVACSHATPPPRGATTLSNHAEAEETGGAQYGVLAALYGGQVGDTDGGAFASLTASGDIWSGFDDVDIYGGLMGGAQGGPVDPEQRQSLPPVVIGAGNRPLVSGPVKQPLDRLGANAGPRLHAPSWRPPCGHRRAR